MTKALPTSQWSAYIEIDKNYTKDTYSGNYFYSSPSLPSSPSEGGGVVVMSDSTSIS
ncbi:hypothetical protein BH18THE2_BH18THE2_11990 [soil metagenome]